MRRAWGWLTNWRNGATLVATVLAVVLLLVVFDAVVGRRQAFEALERQTQQQGDARAAATRRIDLLQSRIDELVGKGEANAQVLGQLIAEVEALREQVRGLGEDPVVAGPSTSPRPSPSPSTTTRPSTPGSPGGPTPAPPSPDPDPEPQPEPDPPSPPEPERPFPCRAVFVPVLCTQGAAPTQRKATP